MWFTTKAAAKAELPDAAVQARAVWDRLDTETDPYRRHRLYDELSRCYAELSSEPLPASCQGDDLQMANLAWVLGTSEYALACRIAGQDEPGVPFSYIPWAADVPDLAQAWQAYWDESDRARRAGLLTARPVPRSAPRSDNGTGPLARDEGVAAHTPGDNPRQFIERAAQAEANIAAALADAAALAASQAAAGHA